MYAFRESHDHSGCNISVGFDFSNTDDFFRVETMWLDLADFIGKEVTEISDLYCLFHDDTVGRYDMYNGCVELAG